MDYFVRDRVRRGVRAAVYRACWRRLEGDEPGAEALLACELPAALSQAVESDAPDDALVRAWVDEDAADFDRAVLIRDLVARQATPAVAPAAAAQPGRIPFAPRRSAPEPMPEPVHPGATAGSPAIADLLEGMLAQDRRMRAAS